MIEKIYTIPVNEAFDASIAEPERGCPFCSLHEKLESDELNLILGASMMEPDTRVKTNEQGFCRRHYDKMLTMKNRLGLALMLESHLDELKEKLSPKGITSLLAPPASSVPAALPKLTGTCYICSRIEYNFSRMLKNTVWLWSEDADFRKKLAAQPFFCLPHFSRLLDAARSELSKKVYPDFYAQASAPVLAYLDSLRADVSHFCKKFDYRYESEPWGNAKNAPDRAADFLRGR